MQILRPHPSLLNQKLWRWDPATCVLERCLSDSGAHSSLRTTVVFASDRDVGRKLIQDFFRDCVKRCQDSGEEYRNEEIP